MGYRAWEVCYLNSEEEAIILYNLGSKLYKNARNSGEAGVTHNYLDLDTVADTALALPDDEQAGSIREHSRNNPALEQEINAVVQKKRLERSLDLNLAALDISTGDQIGPYKILEKLGQGGMGDVFLVDQQEPIRRRVALKVVRLGMDTKQVLGRFGAERQALALMSHPNIAAVFDAGMTESGRPYFVMEYVPGIPITEYADQHRLSIHDRINLLIQACNGMLHAHQKGILHRDLKPGNILVTEEDDKPLLKIIDFGVAKSTQQKLVSNTVYTQIGVFIGTPNYTSPEQAGVTPLDVDTRTDVYSLGVVLFELLVGELPFDPDTFHDKSLGEIQQIIREKEAPSPSARLNSVSLERKNIARHRQASFAEVQRTLKGDLSWIIMRATEKSRSERYPSISALGADLTRYLKGLPVEARPQSAAYRVRRFVGRHRLMVGSVIGMFLALSVGLVVALVAFERSEREAARADQEAERARREAEASHRTTSFLVDLFQVSDPGEARGNEIRARELLDRGAERLNDELREQPIIRATLMRTIGKVYQKLGLHDSARPLLEQAVALHRLHLPSDPELAASLDVLGRQRLEQGELELAESLIREAIEIWESHPETLERDLALGLCDLSTIYLRRQDYELAQELLRKALELRRSALVPLLPSWRMALIPSSARVTRYPRASRNCLINKQMSLSSSTTRMDAPSFSCTEAVSSLFS